MSGGIGLDVRLPIGGLFVVLGLLLGSYGLATGGAAPHSILAPPLNLDLWWGLVMLGAGALLLWGAARGKQRGSAHPAGETPEGRATEAREHELGLER